MREPEQDKSIGGDKDEPGVTISFVEFDINKLNEILSFGDEWSNSDDGNKCMEEFVGLYDNCTGSDKAKHAKILKNYFRRTKSR